MLPKGIATSGFPRVRETCRRVGIEFDPWQSDLNKGLLAKAPGGLYAAAIAGISIPRQVGKTFDIGAVAFAECIAEPGTTVVWTAHHFKVARETFNDLRALAKLPKLAPHIDYDGITTGAGNETIPFRNRSRIVFAARERGAIRGFSKVRLLVLDEAQILTEEALADMAPTMNQAANPLIVLMGTPPKPGDPSEVFTRVRTDALSGTSDDIFYVELSADPSSDRDDRQAWRTANPSYPDRTPARAILRLRRLLSNEDFDREVLGIWDVDSLAGGIPTAAWEACADPLSEIVGTPVLVVSLAPDQSAVSLVAAGKRRDGKTHVEVVRHGAPGQWFIDDAAAISRRQSATVRLHPGHPAGGLLPDLTAAGVPTEMLTSADYTAGCGAFYGAVIAGTLRYRPPQPELNEAIAKASQKRSGETWKWAGEGISALVAATQAVWAVNNTTPGGWAVSL